MAPPSRNNRKSRTTGPPVRHSAVGKVLDAVLTFGAEPLNQKELAGLAGVVEGNVTRAKAATERFGPLLTSNPVRFSSEMGLVLALSVGAERIRAGLVDANGTLHCRTVTEPHRGQLDLPQRALLQHVGRAAADVLEEALSNPQLTRADGTLPVFAAMMALPTPIDRNHRQVGHALSHPSWGVERPFPTLNHAFAAALGQGFTVENTQVMNDSNAASIAFAFDYVRVHEAPRKNVSDQTFRQRSTIMAVRVGGGVGCGIVEVAADHEEIYVSRFLKSRVMVGTHALAGEIGHMPISRSPVDLLNDRAHGIFNLGSIDYDAPCACGQLHHLQALIGAAAFAKRLGIDTRSSDVPLTIQVDEHLATGSSLAARRALLDAGELLGKALIGPVLAMDIKAITVIGALSRPSLIEGLMKTRTDWGRAFDTGAQVDLIDPGRDASWMITRGAGLAMMRQHRHRRLRQIGKRGMVELLRPLNLDLKYVHALRAGSWN